LILTIEVGIAILVALAIFCTKPEYGLFLYGFALGFPDVALALGDAINIRLDDLLLLLFLLRAMVWIPARLAPQQRKIFVGQTIFFFACLLSVAVESVLGKPSAPYETAKMIGCAAIALILPRLVESERRLRFLIAGLMAGGFALVIQVFQRVGAGSLTGLANFQEFKSAATFTTWNPNTIGQASMLLVFSAGVGAIVFSKSHNFGWIWACLGTGFALLPLFVFVRGTSISIAAAFVLFLCLTRRWTWLLLFAGACFAVLLYLHSVDRALLEGATRVDVTSGEGFSHRFERWQAAGEAIRSQPILGQGFGQEWNYLSEVGSGGRAHNAYLSVWVELGVGGIALFLAMIYQFYSVGLSLFRNPQTTGWGALVLALILAACIDSLGLPTLYWEKLPIIALSIATAVAGICERDQSELSTDEIGPPQMEPLSQHI